MGATPAWGTERFLKVACNTGRVPLFPETFPLCCTGSMVTYANEGTQSLGSFQFD
jgi:hypothetical protein